MFEKLNKLTLVESDVGLKTMLDDKEIQGLTYFAIENANDDRIKEYDDGSGDISLYQIKNITIKMDVLFKLKK